jgi:5'-3' exonuclease
LSGKRYEYQGVVLLPFLDVKVIMNLYKKHYDNVGVVDKKRNYFGKTFVYKYTTTARNSVSLNYIDI